MEDRKRGREVFGGRWWWKGVLICLGLQCLALPVVGQEVDEEGSTRAVASLRWGVEWDNNPLRQEDYQGPSDGLSRYLLGLSILTDLAPGGQVSAAIRHGGTIFLSETDASATLTEVRMSGVWRPRPRWAVQASGDFKDRTERLSVRDYQRGGVGIRGSVGVGDVRLWVAPAWRYYAFKPAPISGNTGPVVGVGANWQPRADVMISGAYSLSQRAFQSVAWQVEGDRFVPHPEGELRRDRFEGVQLTAAYQRGWLAEVGVVGSRNGSNSFGQGLTRYGVRATTTVVLPEELFLSVRGEVQRTRYEDPVLIDDIFFLDEESRNQLTVALARPFGDWEVELRYNLYAQEFGIDGAYGRQTIGVSVGYGREGRLP